MLLGQTGIFALGDAAHGLFEFTLNDGAAAEALVRAVANVHAPYSTVGGANLVVGFRPELWRGLAPIPESAHGFVEPIAGSDGFTMPATQADAFVWAASREYDAVFDIGLELAKNVAPLATMVRESTGWSYRRSRDLTGFEDGTENPSLFEAPSIALVPNGLPGEGGSVLLFQRWRHDSAAWNALEVSRQEEIIGRTKADSVEFPDDEKARDSHVARTTLDRNGVELDIFRRNLPYGSVSEHGTLFIGFAGDQSRLHDMLVQMAGADGGPRDALTRYTTPLTGAYYFCPSLNALGEFVTKD